MTSSPHRKLVRHFGQPGHAHELTFSCYRRLPLLSDPPAAELLAHAIDQGGDSAGFVLLAYVFMPEHVHLLVWPTSPSARISRLLAAIKRPHSYRVRRSLEQRRNPRLAELTIRERPGKLAFRFWQEGGGYDRNIHDPHTLTAAIDYIHNNPVRRGLSQRPADWRWSSWGVYHAEQPSAPGPPTVCRWPDIGAAVGR